MISRGDLFSACLDPVVGSEQGGVRPVLVIQNDVGNRYSPTVIVLAVTGQVNKARLPTHVPVACEGTGLLKDSVVLAEQIRTLDKRRLRERIGTLRPEVMARVTEDPASDRECSPCLSHTGLPAQSVCPSANLDSPAHIENTAAA